MLNETETVAHVENVKTTETDIPPKMKRKLS